MDYQQKIFLTSEQLRVDFELTDPATVALASSIAPAAGAATRRSSGSGTGP
jgi:hypothetical protein